ncbi:MAG TPA: hypothetical protein VFM38_03090 [Candidatus Limnocylindrales bacterium]|nr:hypothetical protein [Candidatus Limnocylindrales bacterium]
MTLIQWGIVVAMLTAVVGRFLSPRVADYLVAEPIVQRRMRRHAAIGVGATVGLAVFAALACWFVLAAFVSDVGCAWIAGYGGCLPWVPTPATV